MTNYCEIVSYLEDQPSESTPEPFIKYRQCLRKITEVCHREVLPAPEMEFLELAGLLSYLDAVSENFKIDVAWIVQGRFSDAR